MAGARIAPAVDFISTQHAEEQYFHPVTVANQIDLWRTPGKALWCYGNTTWMEEGTGAQMHRDFLAALLRAPQGVGTNNWHAIGYPERAETEMIQRVIKPAFQLMRAYGGVAAASQTVDQVAIWRSAYEECYEGTRAPERMHYYTMTAAYTACLYAHRPASIVQDEDVLAGALGKYKALIVSFEVPLPDPMLRKLEEFRKQGGLILANRPLAGAFIPPGAVDLGQLFSKSHADFNCNNDYERHVLLEEREGREQGSKLKQAMGDAVQPLADCDDPTTWLSVHRSGQAQYVWAANMKRLPQRPVDFHRYSAFEHTSCPTKTPIRLKAGNDVVYDIFAGRRVEPRQSIVVADMTVFPGATFALLPTAIAQVKLAAGVAPNGLSVTLKAAVVDAQGATIPAAIPMEITFTDPAGAVRHHLWRTAVNGTCQETLPLCLADKPGRWTVSATELLSGQIARGAVRIDLNAAPPAAFVASAVECFRTGEMAKAIATAKTAAIVIADKQRDKLAKPADRLAQVLSARGMKVTRLTTSGYLKDRAEFGWDKFVFAGPYSKELRDRPRRYDLIFTLDTPELPSDICPKDVRNVEPSATDPGAGRALVQYVVMPVYDTEDAVAISGGDEAGLLAGIESLAAPVPSEPPPPALAATALKDVATSSAVVSLDPLRSTLGTPVRELAVSPDGQRVLVGLMAWGNNLITLDEKGRVLQLLAGGKHFPSQLLATEGGFSSLVQENDPRRQPHAPAGSRRQAAPAAGRDGPADRRHARCVGALLRPLETGPRERHARWPARRRHRQPGHRGVGCSRR